MTYQERNKVASLSMSAIVLTYYLLRWAALVRTGSLTEERVFGLWATVIVASIAGIIAASIVAQILGAIVHAIQTGGKEEPSFIEDERDKLIELKGTRVAYVVYSLAVFAAMLSFWRSGQALLMFNILILSGMVGQIAGDVSRLVMYRRGV